MPPSRQLHLDVRDDIRQGHEPFGRIMQTVGALDAGGALVLRAPFEPVPLYAVLGRRGFSHWTECRAADDWSVWFYREARGTPAPASAPPPPGTEPPPRPADLTLDVRGLEPPQPMVRVLEALEGLQPGQRLEMRHDRRPVFLYPQLEARGFAHETDEPGLVRVVIRRGTA